MRYCLHSFNEIVTEWTSLFPHVVDTMHMFHLKSGTNRTLASVAKGVSVLVTYVFAADHGDLFISITLSLSCPPPPFPAANCESGSDQNRIPYKD
jgi:hypothetical protein